MWGEEGFTGLKSSIPSSTSFSSAVNIENIIIMIRVVYWNDANGSTFVMAKIGNDWFEDHDIIVEDCTVSIIIVPLNWPNGPQMQFEEKYF